MIALFRIEAEERTHAQHVAESGDGIVHVSGREPLPEDEDVEESDG